MTRAQRRLMVVSLLTLAVAFATYCLDYRSGDYYGSKDNLVFARSGGFFAVLGSGAIVPAPVPVVTLSQESHGNFSVTIRALYPRPGLTSAEAAVAGLVAPFALIIAAAFFWFGATRGDSAAEAVVDQAPAGAPTMTWLDAHQRVDPDVATENYCRWAFAILVLLFPVMIAVDLTSATLLARFRVPRWAIIWLMLRALAAQRSVSV